MAEPLDVYVKTNDNPVVLEWDTYIKKNKDNHLV